MLIDLEMTGLDASKQEIIQLAAVLLDRKTLREKKSMETYVRPRAWKKRDLESMNVNKIVWEQVKDAPTLAEALEEFERLFNPREVILSYYGGPVDMDFLRVAYKKINKPFTFDYHYFNIWGLFYTYLAIKNKLNNSKKFSGFSLEYLMKIFKLKSEKRHDALEDCRIEAEIFRRIVNDLKK